MRRYFKNLDGNKPKDVFEMVMKEVEKPLLEEVMIHCNWNQSEACKMLGISDYIEANKENQGGIVATTSGWDKND